MHTYTFVCDSPLFEFLPPSLPPSTSFGQCILTNVRDDKCLITESTELLRVRDFFDFVTLHFTHTVHTVRVCVLKVFLQSSTDMGLNIICTSTECAWPLPFMQTLPYQLVFLKLKAPLPMYSFIFMHSTCSYVCV